MRINPPSLLPLFRSEMQVNLLGLVLLQPDRAWNLSEIADTVGAPASSVHRELLRAIDAGLVTRDTRQRPHVYRAEGNAPVFAAVRQLLELTVGVPDRLRQALARVHGVRAAAIHGGWARGKVTSTSDIDVVVVVRGDGDSAAAQRAIRKACREVGREADISVVDPEALSEMARTGSPFWAKIVAGPRIDLIGDLEALG